MSDATASNITLISIETEMTSSFMDYAMSVIVSRALPDARDGLKPVHRRILYAQRGLNNTYNRPYLYICYNLNPALDMATAPTDNSRRLQDLNVILLMNYGLATGFMQSQIGKNIPIAAFAHIIIQGK